MKTGTPTTADSDLAEVCRQAVQGIVRDPDLVQRVTERAEKTRREMLKKHGVQDIGVDIIREMRGELPGA